MKKPIKLSLIQNADLVHDVKLLLNVDLTIDIMITFPNDVFERKDYLNHRYHFKRIIVLEQIRKSVGGDFQYEYLEDDLRLPVLIFTFKNNQKQWYVRIVPVIDSDLFPISRFDQQRNNLRPPHDDQNKQFTNEELVPTPIYNQSILLDMRRREILSDIQSKFQEVSGLIDTVLLLKLWFLNQIGLKDSHLLVCALVSYQLQQDDLMSSMSPFQQFRLLLIALTKDDTYKQIQQSNSSDQKSQREVFCLTDETGEINFLLNSSQGLIRQIRSTAIRSIETLRASDLPAYQILQSLFIKPLPQMLKWDYLYAMKVQVNEKSVFAQDETTIQQIIFDTEKVLQRGLQKRASALRVWYDPKSVSKTAQLEKAQAKDDFICMHIGINIASQGDVWKLQERTLPEDNVARFKEFWGEDRCGMFRFEDGTTGFAVNWSETPSWCKHRVIDEIVRHLVNRHIATSKSRHHVEVLPLSSQFEQQFEVLNVVPVTPNDARGAYLKLKNAQSKMHRYINDLDMDVIALNISMRVDINPYVFNLDPNVLKPNPLFMDSSSLKQSEVYVPRVMIPIDTVLVVEHSGKWPNDLEQYKAVKTSLATQYAEHLETKHKLYVRIVDEAIDVYLDGFVFRLHIRSAKDDVLDLERGREMKCKIEHSGLMNFVTGEHPSISGAIRMLKLWAQCNLLGINVKSEALELIACAAYVMKGPRAAPGTPVAGFLCALQLLGNFRWKEERMVVDPQKKIDSKEVSELLQQSRKQEEVDGCCMCICTSYDPEGTFWTQNRPSQVVLPRIVSLAQETFDRLRNHYENPFSSSSKSLPLVYPKNILNDFDVLLHLRREALPWGQALDDSSQSRSDTTEIRPHKRARTVLMGFTQSAIQKAGKKALKDEIVVGFNPVEHCLQFLEENYGKYGIYFGNCVMGDVIAIKWNAKSFLGGDLDVEQSGGQTSAPMLCEPEELHVDVVQILQDVQHNLQGLIRNIEFVTGI
eukprot:TRINITY_DN4538_c0_g1_i3.p1 TRINITY_DN4538_c0_g1~~TRINITY_DN4538_c0_g1_i3.p1  ORF type:complete len:1105 (+),score=129.74 TRINITY_DN4538_c0_g1_i3:380-3316(+)